MAEIPKPLSPPPADSGAKNPSPVEAGNGSGAPANAPAPSPLSVQPPPLAKSTSTLFGGKRGGRTRKDGLVPGSPEAREANLQKDRDRKSASYLASKSVPVPVLPPPLTGSLPANPTQPPPGGVVGLPPIADDAWTAQEAQPLVVHSLPVVEHLLTARRLGKLRDAKMPGALISQVKSDSAWPETVKLTLNQSLPGSAAKLLNFVHFPKLFKDELSSLPALALLFQHEAAVNERLDKIIADWKKEHPDPEKPASPAKTP